MRRRKDSGHKEALALFHEAAKRVPAYKDFLQKHRLDHKKIKTPDDFSRFVPPIDKRNYLTQYPLNELCWDGNLFLNRTISVSSGSSGAPFFWPRGKAQDEEGARMHERLFRDVFDMGKQRTLVLVCFSMGTWIAGSFTASSVLGVANKGYPVNLITPGLEKTEAIKAVRSLHGYYDQIVLVGYPPFIKDIIEEGTRSGIKWSKLHTRLLMAGESFSEEWRDYVLRLIRAKDPYRDAINIYGSADAAMLGHETPVSILARRIWNSRPSAMRNMFGASVLPSIAQYDPTLKYFEQSPEGELLFTTRSGIPLIRYNIHDTGGVCTFDQIIEPIRERFYDRAAKHNIDVNAWHLPFIFLNGRQDFTVTIYAVNIYPENVKAALVDSRIRRWTTGRFTMATKYYSDMDQYFEINVELAKGFVAKKQHLDLLQEVALQKLLKLNREFAKLYAAIGDKAKPHVHLIEFGDEQYFARGVKHRWVKKEE